MTYPGGSSSGVHSRMPSTGAPQSGGAIGVRLASMPAVIRTPVAGSVANVRNTSSVAALHAATRPRGLSRWTPQLAPAAYDVVAVASSAAQIVVGTPASANVMAVVRPMTPAPTTRTPLHGCGHALDRTVTCVDTLARREVAGRGDGLRFGR